MSFWSKIRNALRDCALTGVSCLCIASIASSADFRAGIELGLGERAPDGAADRRVVGSGLAHASLCVAPTDFLDLRLGYANGTSYDAKLRAKDGQASRQSWTFAVMFSPPSLKGYAVGYAFSFYGREAIRFKDDIDDSGDEEKVYEEARMDTRALRFEGPISDVFFWTTAIERVERELLVREVEATDTALVSRERDVTGSWGLAAGVSLKLGGKK